MKLHGVPAEIEAIRSSLGNGMEEGLSRRVVTRS